MTRARTTQGAPGRGPAGGPVVSSLARWAPRTNRVPTGSEHRRDGGLSRSDFLPAVGGGYAVACCTRGVAQFGSALRSGRRGRGFKSRHPDYSVAAVTDGGHSSLEPRDPAGRARFDPLRMWLLCDHVPLAPARPCPGGGGGAGRTCSSRRVAVRETRDLDGKLMPGVLTSRGPDAMCAQCASGEPCGAWTRQRGGSRRRQ